MTDTSQNKTPEYQLPISREEDIREAIAYIRTLFVLSESKAKTTANQETAAFTCAICALEDSLVLEKYGGIAHVLQLAQAEKAGLLLRLPCPDGTPYYRIVRECHRCSAYDGSGIGDTYCTLSKDYLNHEFDAVSIPGCPIPLEVQEYTFYAGTFERNHWENDFGKSIFLDRDKALARADELNHQREALNAPRHTNTEQGR